MPTKTLTRATPARARRTGHQLPVPISTLQNMHMFDMPFGAIGIGDMSNMPTRGRGRQAKPDTTHLQHLASDVHMAIIGRAFLMTTLTTLAHLFAGAAFEPGMTAQHKQRAPWGSKTGRRKRRRAAAT